MNILAIPFVKHLKIKQEEDTLYLEPNHEFQNHLGTIHASAQFTLAETQSGLFLSLLFPEQKEQVLPLLRSSNVKYKKPAKGRVKAQASVKPKELKRFQEQFKKGRATISVSVEVLNENNEVTMVGKFVWFISVSYPQPSTEHNQPPTPL